MSTTETKAPKLTTCERRALVFCQSLADNDGGQIQVHWSRGGTYGSQASIYSGTGGLCYRTGGCGFDKLSSCLANVLRFMAPLGADEHRRIWGAGGAGLCSVQDRLAAIGWKLEQIVNSKNLDVFQLSRMEAAS